MTQEQFFAAMQRSFEENLEISRKKNADYADNDDAFKNFRACELAGISVEQGIIVRMSDKLVRAGNLLTREAKVTDESILDTLSDLANYATILKVYIKNDKKL